MNPTLYYPTCIFLLFIFAHSVVWKKEEWALGGLLIFAVLTLVPYLNTMFLLLYGLTKLEEWHENH